MKKQYKSLSALFLVTMPVIIALSSMLSEFNFLDFTYLLFVSILFIRYYFVTRKQQ